MLNLSTLPASYNPGNLDEAAATAVINHSSGIGTMDFSFRLLNRDLTPVEVPGSLNPNAPALTLPALIRALALHAVD